MNETVNVIGGGLAGAEAAWQLAQRGIPVKLWEMRPLRPTPVHQTGYLAELVCSNSLKSDLADTAQGLLKKEMEQMGSLLLQCARATRVPAGSALAVDRDRFAALVTSCLQDHDRIEIMREEVTRIPTDGINIVATGPLTAESLLQEIAAENLYFYDAVAPSVTLNSLDQQRIFKASRYGKGDDDYYNCPLNREEYEKFWQELTDADIFEGHSIDKKMFFSGCMPVEVIARRGLDTLRFGPMRPVGLVDPCSGKRAWAVVQLRQENREGTVYGLVGFQTRLRWAEQDRIFRMIPGLEQAEFVRYGIMHRNTYINSPRLLSPTLQLKSRASLLFAGQITGVEGYMESAATGIVAGMNAARLVCGQEPAVLSPVTMIGALIHFITAGNDDNFQPMNANFGILPPLPDSIRDKKARYQRYVERAMVEMRKISELFLEHVVKEF